MEQTNGIVTKRDEREDQGRCDRASDAFEPWPLHWNDLPVDSHELLALCAPRPVFAGAGTLSGDGWADPKGMFLAAAAAGPVYQLLGRKDLGTTEFPPLETALIGGDIAYREHAGGHTDLPNWPTFLTFADRYMKTSRR